MRTPRRSVGLRLITSDNVSPIDDTVPPSDRNIASVGLIVAVRRHEKGERTGTCGGIKVGAGGPVSVSKRLGRPVDGGLVASNVASDGGAVGASQPLAGNSRLATNAPTGTSGAGTGVSKVTRSISIHIVIVGVGTTFTRHTT